MHNTQRKGVRIVRRASLLSAWCIVGGLRAQHAYALDQSVGPHLAQPFLGPNGARISLVKLADTYNLDGTGVRLGMIEGTGRPRDTHDALNTFVTVRPILPPAVDPGIMQHPTNVAGVLIGREFMFVDPVTGNHTITGVASGGRLWSTWFSDPIGAQDFYQSMGWLQGNNVSVINMSDFMRLADGTGNPDPSQNGDGAAARFVDQYIRVNDIVFVKSAGNRGPGAMTITTPGDAFNVITVGRTGAGPGETGPESEDYTRVHSSDTETPKGSSRGPTVDGRHKPDIVAPGSKIWTPGSNANNGFFEQSGTSFAAPHVSGTAALLYQYGTAQGLAPSHLKIKAILLNSASKHVRDPHPNDPGGVPDRSWPVWRANNYPPPVGGTTFSVIPLNDAMGVGQLNGLAAVRQYVPGGRNDLGLEVSDVAANSANTYNIFFGGETLKPGSLVTATLTWDRFTELRAGMPPSNPNSYIFNPLRNLNLELVNRATGQVVYRSQSGGEANADGGDNVEHIYFNVPVEGNYDLVVRNRSAEQVRFALAYASGTSDGAAFTVDRGAQGRQASGPGTFPNDVNALGRAGPGNFSIGGEIFSSSLNGTNMQRLSGALTTRSRVGPHNGPPVSLNLLDGSRGVLGLRAAADVMGRTDQITGLSWGRDGTRTAPGSSSFLDSIILFSVDAASAGDINTDVNFQARLSPDGGVPPRPFPNNNGGGGQGNGHEAAGDIFKAGPLTPFGFYPSAQMAGAGQGNNLLVHDESKLGLQAGAGRGSLLAGATEDNLRDFEMDNIRSYVDADGDGMHTRPMFFTLSPDSNTIFNSGGGFTAADIFVSMNQDPDPNTFGLEAPVGGFTFFNIFARRAVLGLREGDIIDALILSDTGPNNEPDGMLAVNMDSAMFSLAPGSPTLALFNLSPADIFYTGFNNNFNSFIDFNQLGLLQTDNIDGLDIASVPEAVTTVALIQLAGALLLVRRRRGNR